MRSGPENAVKKRIKEILDRHNIFNFPIAASPYGVSGISDRLCVLPNGRLLAIEAKALGKKATPLQAEFGRRVQENKGHFMVIDGPVGLIELETFLKEMRYDNYLGWAEK